MKTKIESFLSTLLIFFLLVSLVCLSFVYMFSFNTRDETKFDSDDMEALEQNFAAAGYMDDAGVDNILPVFVGVSLPGEGERVGAFGADVLEQMYTDCFEVVWQYFVHGTAHAISNSSADDYIRMAKNNGFIYIKYASAYPKSVIVSFTRKDTFALNISDEYIKEIFVFKNNYTNSVCVVTVSDTGNNYLYTGSFGFDENFNKNIVNEYNNAEGTFDFSFSSEKESEVFISKEKYSDAIYRNSIIPKGEIFLDGLSFENVSDRLASQGSYDRLLSLFTLNPEKISVFTESDGTRTFFEEGQNVSIAVDGSVKYSAVGAGGIDIGDVIGYRSENSEYSLRDKIGATLCIVREMTEITYISENIKIRLSGIFYDENDNFVITYSASYKGIPIICENAFFSFTVSGDRIKSVDCSMFDVVAYGDSVLPNAMWEYITYAASAQGKVYSQLVPAYAYDESAENVYARYYSRSACMEVNG